ncbi:putative mediator of RNA polymerase II transcription subunit 26 [Lucilia cuprina]|uniref:putative mediator of RNA polymerase II transcription subunit 26 n=1 Tax=Lucilia cuprina TaxID=7375 RepID=UPI001F0539C5|nr:putative mediator of RNA polymerase II transcription subunit 26 [Lucilia cuprina]
MFFSLLQTLVCVLLVNSGLYALHLTSSNTAGSNSPSNNNGPTHNAAQLTKPSATNPFQSTSNRLNEELADLAQLERERLMVMGLVKQTAEESGYHGRPIITGRIKMHPAEDMDSEYSAWLQQQARNVMFGNVVKQPLNDEEDYDSGGGGSFDPLRSTNGKYDYGRIVQPVEREFENPHNLDLDDFMELEPVQEEEDMFPDMDGYAYIEELMAEENKERLQHHYQTQPQHHQQMPQFPGFRQQQQQPQSHHMPLNHNYQNHEATMDKNQQVLQDFFEKEQKLQNLNHQQQQQQQQQQFNNKYRNNIRMQQKWLRKRNQLQQQQQQLPRNIFGQKNNKQQPLQQQPALHHFKTLSSNKLSLANSEATATTRINSHNNNNNNKPIDTAQLLKNSEQKQNTHDTQLNKEDKTKFSSSSSSAANKSEKSLNAANLEQNPEQLQHPNHKRSGLNPASLASSAGVSSPHSLASQLMLRTARGQRQYDVPQIECPTAMDGMERFACPTPDLQGRYRCIDDHVLCDGFLDCPEGEDEDRRSCMFYKTLNVMLNVPK